MGEVIIGIDAGTSVVKSVAFDLDGNQIGSASTPNKYELLPDGAAIQSMEGTWVDCARTLRDLVRQISAEDYRIAAVAVTAQGDGTWLVDKKNQPVTDGWTWLDARAKSTVAELSACALEAQRFQLTGTGLNTCQMGVQLAHMKAHYPELLKQADAALHCKDWLYLKLTGVRATDPSEACFTFGNFRTRRYEEPVLESLGLQEHGSLLPPILDGTTTSHPLNKDGARETGLPEGTPIVLGFVDMVCTALGAGALSDVPDVGCTILGSTGVHIKVVAADRVVLNDNHTGYVMAMPEDNAVAQMQSNMAATLNLDWLLDMGSELISSFGEPVPKELLVKRIDEWLDESCPGQLLYHPYISDAGERGPFVNGNACASFMGLRSTHRFGDLTRSVIEGLGLATMDCYLAMGELPSELRLSGGAVRSRNLRSIIAGCVDSPVRTTTRGEAGAAGAAMIAAVSIGAYDGMRTCSLDWAESCLTESEQPDSGLVETYRALYEPYKLHRQNSPAVWERLSQLNRATKV